MFQIIFAGETVGRWTGTEVAHDYANQVSSVSKV